MSTTPLLTVGLATFDDFDGTYFSVQSLGLHHREVAAQTEIVVVDNNPSGEHGKMNRDFLGWLAQGRVFANVQYIPFTERGGTAAPRDLIFRVANAPSVLCMDSHVLLAAGALKALTDWFGSHPDSNDLLSGPLLYDDLRPHATHFTAEWEAGMWGKWSTAWTCRCGHMIVGTQRGTDGKVAYHLVANPALTVDPGCNRCESWLPAIQWEGHEFHLDKNGWKPRGWYSGEQPFEIGSHGLGIFAMRKDAWPGFNPQFRGFGGEEWYLHEKVRKAGGKCLCLPALQWLHRFGRVNGIKYRLDNFDKARNYWLGHTELGLDVEPIRKHFVDGNLITAAHWKAITDGKDSLESFQIVQTPATGGCTACAGSKMESLEQWYKKAAETPGDINEHVPTLRELASGKDVVVEITVRQDVATIGLLAGQPKRLISITPKPMADGEHLKRLAGKTQVETIAGEAATVALPDKIDLLFIDSIPHSADALWVQLLAHGQKARKIVLHDTVVYGEQGDNGGPGLLPAVRRWIKEHPEWSVLTHHRNNHGLLILTREAREKKKLPPKWKQGWNALKASVRNKTNVIADGYGPIAGTEAHERRLSLCVLCESHTDGRCSECGCPCDKKASYPKEFCPLGVWDSESEADKQAA